MKISISLPNSIGEMEAPSISQRKNNSVPTKRIMGTEVPAIYNTLILLRMEIFIVPDRADSLPL